MQNTTDENFYSSPDGCQTSSLLGFADCLTNQLGTMDGVPYTEPSVPTTSSIPTPLETDLTLRKFFLVTDPDNDGSLTPVKIYPSQLRGIETKAGTTRHPAKFITNKVADLMFTKEELSNSHGVNSLNRNKTEALKEYVYKRCESLHFQMVSPREFQTIMQNKICNARMALKCSKYM